MKAAHVAGRVGLRPMSRLGKLARHILVQLYHAKLILEMLHLYLEAYKS